MMAFRRVLPVLLIAGLIGIGLLLDGRRRRATLRVEEVPVHVEGPSRGTGSTSLDDLAALVEDVESAFKSSEVKPYEPIFTLRDGSARRASVIEANAEVLAAWSWTRDARQASESAVRMAVLVWCNLTPEEGDPLWSLILFWRTTPRCRLFRPGEHAGWSWVDALSRWNDRFAEVVLFFDREPMLDDVQTVFNHFGEETPGSIFPLLPDDQGKSAYSILGLRPHIVAEVWERRIGPLSELPRGGQSP
jgi:hypothetical protein